MSEEEDDAAFRARIEGFARKLNALVDAEEDADGLAACIMGYGIGAALGSGATEQDAREIFEKSLAIQVELRMQLLAPRGQA